MKTLEEKIISVRFITRSVLAYVCGYGIKLSVLFFYLFKAAVPNEYIRLLPAMLVGFALAPILLVISLHSDRVLTKRIIAVFDAIVWFFILDVDHTTGTYDIIKIVFISVFNGFAAYHLMTIIKNKLVKRGKSAAELQNELDQSETALEITQTKLDKFKKDQDQLYQNIAALEKDVIHARNHFYCRHCSAEFDSPDKVKRHEATCSFNPNNQAEIKDL